MLLCIVAIKQSKNIEKNLKKISNIPSVLFAFTVTGRYDIIAMVLATSRKMLHDLLSKQIVEIESVDAAETFVVLDSDGLQYPASKICSLLEIDGNV